MIKNGKYIAVRPNSLIEARYDLTLRQNDILDMVLCKIDDNNNYMYELDIDDYKKLYKTDTSNIYRDMKKAVKEFEGQGFYLIDNENKREIFFVWFASIDYINSEGKIIVEIGQRLKSLLVEMKKKIFYKIEYPLNFTSIYSKRIYYYLKSFNDTGWRTDNLNDLRKKLQCPKSYNKYGLFRSKVLDMAYKEINNYSDISFEYEEIKTSRKVTGIRFFIKTNLKSKSIVDKPAEPSSVRNINLIKTVQCIFNKNITETEARKILEAAKNDLKIIEEKYNVVCKMTNINNIVGAVIQAIKEDWQKQKYRTNTENFNNFKQRKYDFEDLEKKLLGWQ